MSEDYPLKPTESDLERESLDAAEPEEPRCTTCGGAGCEYGCGRCESANIGPDSHRVCTACGGSGETCLTGPGEPSSLPPTRGCPGKVDGWPCTREPGHDGGIHAPHEYRRGSLGAKRCAECGETKARHAAPTPSEGSPE